MDINLFHASAGHVNEFSMRETAKQQGVRLVGDAAMCGLRGGEGQAGPGAAAWHPRGGTRIAVARGYGMRAKSDTLKFVQRFLADMNGMGTPGCFRMDNGGEFNGSAFISFCDAASIRREYTAPDTPKQNAVVESAIWRAMKGAHAACRHILAMGHVDLSSIRNVGVNGHRLWLASALSASACFNRSATKANLGLMSPFEAFFGRKPSLTVVPFSRRG
ncbi:unnamed protein product [Ectocarpus sp. CCAP 1310/34]|nr:unnamed protein product [Ectocarpus sp. CCAP 1310/34]